MIYEFNSRLIVQKSNGSKYYLPVVSATTEHSFPYSVPTGNVEIIANDGEVDYISNVRFDDIIRLQVAVRYSKSERWVWKDLLEGRIITPKSQWGHGSTANIQCVGHIHEASYKLLSDAHTFSESTQLGTIATAFNGSLTRTQVTVPVTYTLTAPYTIISWQKYIKDVFADLEKISGHAYYFDTITTYNSSNNLSNVNIEFKPLPATFTNKYKIISGTPRFLSCDFEVNGSGLYNHVFEIGAKPTTGSQYKGSASDAPSIAQYNTRAMCNTDTSLGSDALCSKLASGILSITKQLEKSGPVEIMGTPEAKICDLVHVKIDTIDVDGGPINNYMRVVRVSHTISKDGFTTSLELNRVRKSTNDYMAEFARQNRLTTSQFIS